MKKKLVTRIPAARIKKIMQTDEEVGKIAQAVPLLVSKATELFLQSLCDKTSDVTLERGAKTITAFHLKQCIEKFNVFDFLQEIVSKVPDMGHGTGGDRHGARRRKAHEEDKESDDELKRPKVVDNCRGRGRGRGRSRGRGRGRGRGSKSSTRTVAVEEKYEEDLDLSPEHSDTQVTTPEERTENNAEAHQSKENVGSDNTIFARGFDLNLDLDENGDIAMMQQNVKHEEQYLSSSHSDGDDVIMQPLQLQMHFSRTIDQDEDDYDNDDV